MRARRFGPEPSPDPRFDPYRRGVARLWAGEKLVGYLVTRVQAWWTVVGPFWRRRGVDPVERPEWLLSYLRHDPRDHSDGWDDGVVSDNVDGEIADWAANRFVLPHGEVVRVEWLSEPEAAEAWAEYGWHDARG